MLKRLAPLLLTSLALSFVISCGKDKSSGTDGKQIVKAGAGLSAGRNSCALTIRGVVTSCIEAPGFFYPAAPCQGVTNSNSEIIGTIQDASCDRATALGQCFLDLEVPEIAYFYNSSSMSPNMKASCEKNGGQFTSF